MKKIYSVVLFVMLVGGICAQEDLAPVNIEVRNTSDSINTEVQIIFEIDSNWIVYDSITGEDGPIPLTIKANDDGYLVKPTLKKKYDELFAMDIYYIENKAVYEYIFHDKAVMEELVIEIEYMSCNLVSGVCLPPVNQLFTIPLK